MKMNNFKKGIVLISITLSFAACKFLNVAERKPDFKTPITYNNELDSDNLADINWKIFFADTYLVSLIDTALQNNQELNVMLQEIAQSKNEIRSKKGDYLPFLTPMATVGTDKASKYSREGAVESNLPIAPGKSFPEPLNEFRFGAFATWEVDIWHRLRNAKNAAVTRYLASIAGKNFMVTNLVAETAKTYYELMALDNQLLIIKQNIVVLTDALEIVKLQKEAARTTELAVKKFEAEVYKFQSHQFEMAQRIYETENKLNYILGRFNRPILRQSSKFSALIPDTLHAGIPSQLLTNRPDIRQAELNLIASKLDIKVAKARFYPSFNISAGVGFQAFNPMYLIKMPESLLFSLAGELVAPLVNRNAIKADFFNANARQIQAAIHYERSILNAFVEVSNQVSKIGNLDKSYRFKSLEVAALQQSIEISINLFKSARADYMEVLLTQRDALTARVELIETKNQQLLARVNLYQALGGGWK